MSQTSRRPTVLIQVDLDSLWAVKTVYGLPVSQRDFDDDPLYLLGMTRFLDLFRKRGVRATFFAIGRDCAVPAKQALLRRAAAEGHEIANHSQNHLVGLGARNPEEIDREIRLAGDAIEAATGCRPVGFRAPGYDASARVLQAVARAGMLYDSSVLPTRAGAILRGAAAFFGSGEATGGAGGHYGSGPVWKAPRAPYFPDLEAPWKPRTAQKGHAEACILNEVESPWKPRTPQKGHAEACTLNEVEAPWKPRTAQKGHAEACTLNEVEAPWKPRTAQKGHAEACTLNEVEAPWKPRTPEKGHAEACTLNEVETPWKPRTAQKGHAEASTPNEIEAPWKPRTPENGHDEACTLNEVEAPWKPRTPEKGHAEACTLNNLVELPVGVTPFLRLPVHASVAMAAGWAWTRMALGGLIRSSPSALVYVFHAIDLVGGEDLPGLPGGWVGRRVFRQSLARKAGFVEGVLGFLLARCDSRLSRDFAAAEAAREASRSAQAVE